MESGASIIEVEEAQYADWKTTEALPYSVRNSEFTAIMAQRTKFDWRLAAFPAADVHVLIAHLKRTLDDIGEPIHENWQNDNAFSERTRHIVDFRLNCAYMLLAGADGATQRTRPAIEDCRWVPRRLAILVGAHDLDAWDETCEADYNDDTASCGGFQCDADCHCTVAPYRLFYGQIERFDTSYEDDGTRCADTFYNVEHAVICSACWVAGRQAEALRRHYDKTAPPPQAVCVNIERLAPENQRLIEAEAVENV